MTMLGFTDDPGDYRYTDPGATQRHYIGGGQFADAPTEIIRTDGHKHKASCHGPIGELQCGLREETIDPKWLPLDPSLEAPAEPPTRTVKHKLHPMQWVVYITVIVTCLLLLYGAYETHQLIDNLANNLVTIGERMLGGNK
jgi:hypothetical protein